MGTQNLPKTGDKAFFKNAFLGIVLNVEKLESKYSRDVTHLITIKTENGCPVIGKRKNKEFGKDTYNFS